MKRVTNQLIVLFLLMVVGVSSAGRFQLNGSRFSNAVGNKGFSLKIRKGLNKIQETIPRIPIAFAETLKVSTKSFAYNSALFIPLMLATDIKNIKNVKPWLVTGCEKGMSFAKASAIYAVRMRIWVQSFNPLTSLFSLTGWRGSVQKITCKR
jgi:hypothetical protein